MRSAFGLWLVDPKDDTVPVSVSKSISAWSFEKDEFDISQDIETVGDTNCAEYSTGWLVDIVERNTRLSLPPRKEPVPSPRIRFRLAIISKDSELRDMRPVEFLRDATA